MLMRTLRFVAAIAGVACCAAGSMAADDPPGDKGSKPKLGRAKLIVYDAERGLIKIANGSKDVTLLVDPATVKLTVDGEPTDKKLGDLEPGTNLEIFLNKEKTTAIAINAEGPGLRRTVDAIDLVKRTIRVRSGKKVDEFMLDKDCEVFDERTKKAGSLEDVKLGQLVQIRLSLDKSHITEVTITGK